MTQEEIIEGNKLIAEFMGLHKPETEEFREHWIYPEGKSKHAHTNETIDPSNLQYHTSWDWLMPVVEKIETLDNPIQGIKCYVDICTRYSIVSYSDFPKSIQVKCPFTQLNKIEATWSAVVSFIKWYKKEV